MSLGEMLARQVFFPLHERLRGRRTLREMSGLARVARLPAAQLAVHCDTALGELLQFCERLPFYRERFERYGVAPCGNPVEMLRRLPPLTKAQVRQAAAAMIWPRVSGGLQPCVSGGTSGDTLHFFVDRRRQAQSMGARLFMQSLFGVRPGDRRMWLWGSPIELKQSHVRGVRDRLINEIVLDAFAMSPAEMDGYLRQMKAYQPRLLIGYSSAVARLAAHAAGRYSPRDFPALRVAVLTADEVTAEHREVIRAVFGCPVASEYGSREAGLIAHECPHGTMHVISPHVLVEVLDGDMPAAPGQVGSIACTNLGGRAQPMLRYLIGDIGALGPRDCRCGLALPSLSIHGARITSFITLPDGRLCSGHLAAYLVRSDRAVREFRVIQHEIGRFEVQVALDSGPADEVLRGIERRFAEYFGSQVRVECRAFEHIPLDPSGKRRHFISRVARTIDRFEVIDGRLAERVIPHHGEVPREVEAERAAISESAGVTTQA